MQREKVMQHTTTETNTGCLTMNESTNREVDTITTKDLPGLRAEMCAHADNENFSDTFRAACQHVIAAIDRARDEDEATHAPLKAALEEYMRIGKYELLLHGSCAGCVPC
jgi:hypothetical protein